MRRFHLSAALLVLVALGSLISWAHAEPIQGRSQVTSTISSTTDSNIACFSGSGGKRIKDCGTISLASDAQHGNRGGGALHANVVAAGAAGFMTGSDKTKLDGIASGANVVGAASSTDNAVVRFDLTTGKLIQDSAVTIDDSGRFNGVSSNGVVSAFRTTALSSGGTSGAAILMFNQSIGVYAGSGAPTVSAGKGSLYLRSDGSSTTTRIYVNTDGSTGWTHLVTGT